MMCLKKLPYYLFLLFLPCIECRLPVAILHVESESQSADLCAIYNPYYSAVPETLKDTPKYPIYIPPSKNGCISHSAVGVWNSSVFITSDGTCKFFVKLQLAYQAQAKQVILISKKKHLSEFPVGSAKEHKQVHISVGMIGDTSWKKVTSAIGIPKFAQLYHPHEKVFDPNLVVLWLIAVLTVWAGGYWSGLTMKRDRNTSNEETKDGIKECNDKLIFPPLSAVMVLVFIVMICVVLLLLYFFYKYLIYVVIGIFAIATIQGTYECLSGIMSMCSRGHCRIPENNLPFLSSQPEVQSVVLFCFSLGLSIYWVIIRNSMHAWILQDFLGICFCISLLKMFKLPSLKISTILLLSLLVYDIFFVFITPFFSAQGKSVMVEVATGHGSKEQLPMVIKVPKIFKSPLSMCERPYSLLGFGDILLPGLFVAFCHNFDVLAEVKYRAYFIATGIGYAVGLTITFVALLLMNTGQPALLYLAPSVLIAAVLVGWYRGELKELWAGQIDSKKNRHTPISQDNDEQGIISAEVINEDDLIDHQGIINEDPQDHAK